MIVRLPRGIDIDINNVPDDFEAQIKVAFGEYTKGTAEAYTYEDRLRFLDLCIEAINGGKNSEETVMEYLKNRMEQDIRSGEFPREEDYYSFDFMVEMFEMGKEYQNLHQKGYKHEKENKEKVITRIIQALYAE